MKHVFGVVRGSELLGLVELAEEVRIIPLEEDEPVMIIVNKENIENVDENALYLVLIKADKLSQILSLKLPKAEEVQREEEKSTKRDLIEEIYEKIKWNLAEISNNAPFDIIDFVKEKDEDTGLWVFKFRLEKKKTISISIHGAAKMLWQYVMKVLKEERYPQPVILAVSMEGKVIFMIADVVLDEMIRAVATSVGLVLKDYIVLLDMANEMVDVIVLAEKSPDAKVGLFSGYKVSEEIAKVVKERMMRKLKVRVKLKVGSSTTSRYFEHVPIYSVYTHPHRVLQQAAPLQLVLEGFQQGVGDLQVPQVAPHVFLALVLPNHYRLQPRPELLHLAGHLQQDVVLPHNKPPVGIGSGPRLQFHQFVYRIYHHTHYGSMRSGGGVGALPSGHLPQGVPGNSRPLTRNAWWWGAWPGVWTTRTSTSPTFSAPSSVATSLLSSTGVAGP